MKEDEEREEGRGGGWWEGARRVGRRNERERTESRENCERTSERESPCSSSAKKTLRFISVRFFQCRRRPDDNSQARHSLPLSLSLLLSPSSSSYSVAILPPTFFLPLSLLPVLLYSFSISRSISPSLSLSLLFALSGPTERTNGLRPDARIEAWSIELCLLFVPDCHSSPGVLSVSLRAVCPDEM